MSYSSCADSYEVIASGLPPHPSYPFPANQQIDSANTTQQVLQIIMFI